jgi:hypothetical protein
MIDNPQPAWLPLLLLALPGIAFAAYAVNEAVFPHGARPLCTVPAIGMVLALLPTHMLALACGSLTIGLAVAWVVAGTAGYVWILRYWRDFWCRTSPQRADMAQRLGIAVLSTAPIVLPTILLNFFDDAYFNGHEAIIAHLQNGTYPPRYLYEPSLPLRYHYGFDLAGAIVTGLLRIRLDQAIDLLTLALWPCMFLLLWRVGEHFGGRRAGLLVALTVCFSGGWPVPCTPDGFAATGVQSLALRVLGRCSIEGLAINPPFIAYFFQHPWSLAVPIFCLVVLLRAALAWSANQQLAITVLVCSLSLLSLCQAVLFITTVVALGLSEIWDLLRTRNYTGGNVLLGIGASLIIAKLMGGFFVSGSFPLAGGIFDTGLFLRDPSNTAVAQMQWNIASFGILMVLGTVGMLRARRGKAFLTFLAAPAFVIVNALRYEYTWDIVKFGAVSFIALAIGAGLALADLARWADTSGRRIICGLIAMVLLGQGISYPLFATLLFDPEHRPPLSIQMIRPYLSSAYPLDPDQGRAVSFLRGHMKPMDILYRAEEKSEPYAIWGGLPTQASVYPADSGDNDAYGLGKRKFAARKDLVRISENWLDRLAAEHVAWVVTDPDDVAINAVLDGAEEQGRAVVAAQFGEVRVFRLQ